MGMSQEVKDFAAGFTSGFKMMDDSFYKQALSDYYRKGGKKGNKGILGYATGDDDSRAPGLFGWLSGDKKDERDPVEIGAENLIRAEKEAIAAGRPDDVAKIREMQKLHVQQNRPSASPSTAVKAPAAKALAPSASPTENPPTVPANPATPIRGINQGTSSLGSGNVVVGDASSEDTRSLDESNAFSVADATEALPLEPEYEIANVGFTGGLMRKAIPDMSSAPSMEPSNPPLIERGPVREDEAVSVDTEDEPAASTDEDADFDFTLQMEKSAAPGLEAGLRLMQQRFTDPVTAVPDGDPTISNGAYALSQNEGAATEEEVRAIDSVIDPEGKLPAAAKSAARTSAIWEFYSSQDNPDKAAELIQRLMLYDRKNAQTRGALAVQAFEDGRISEGVRLIQDANNNDTASATLIQKAVYNPDDQTVTAVVRDESGKQEVKLPIQQVAAEAKNIANGRASFDRLMETVGKRQSAGKGSGSGAEAIASEVFRARTNLQRAMRTNDPKAIAEARSIYEAAEDKAVDFAAKYGPKADRVLKGLGVLNTQPKDPKPAAQPRQPVPTEKERAELAKRKELTDLQGKYQDRLYNAYSLAQAGIKVDEDGNVTEAVPAGPGGRRSEVAAEAQARETQRPTMERMGNQYNVERSGLAYRQAPELKRYAEQSFEDRTERLAEDTAGLVASRAEKGKPPIMDAKQQAQFVREADRLAMKNNVSHGAIVEFLWNAKNNLNEGIKYDAKTGMVQLGSTKLFVDEDMLRDIAAARGALDKKAKGMVEGMDAKAIDRYKQNSRSARDRDEREQALKGAVRQAVETDALPSTDGATPRARAEAGRRFIEVQRERDKMRAQAPSYPNPAGRDYTDEEREAIARQRRRFGYQTANPNNTPRSQAIETNDPINDGPTAADRARANRRLIEDQKRAEQQRRQGSGSNDTERQRRRWGYPTGN